MNIALVGYGKMGKTIEKIAQERGHTIVLRIEENNLAQALAQSAVKPDVAIEFSMPEAAYSNIMTCLENGIPVVCGTTGWLEHKPAVDAYVTNNKGGFFYASNYSVGVNLFFKLNKYLAKLMNNYPTYEASMLEVHHTEKLDAPSGTGITLAEGVLETLSRKQKWVNAETSQPEELSIISRREPNVPGTHTVTYTSAVDTIEITHTAHSRTGFALGAVIAAEWLPGKQGSFGMDDLLNLD
jgi:4-hydroxy-tetrahydrodipicolinate reductase